VWEASIRSVCANGIVFFGFGWFCCENVMCLVVGLWQGRYSVVGAQPCMEIVAKENMVTIMDHEEGRKTEEIALDPLAIPRRIMDKWTPQLIDDLPEAFCGIWIVLIIDIYLLYCIILLCFDVSVCCICICVIFMS